MPQVGRQLATILFLDIVGSTTVAAQIGDARFRELTSRFYRIVRRSVKEHGGREEDTAGDGFFGTFPNPTQAVRCACAIAEAVRDLGVETRAGLHTGEIEKGAGKSAGIAVVIASRVMSLAGPGEVLVTSTTRDLAAGSGLEFEDVSAHELRGVPGTWQVVAVRSVDGRAVGTTLAAAEAAVRLEAIEPRVTQRRRRERLLAGAGLAVVATVVGLALLGRLTPAGSADVATSVMAIDPATNQVRFTVDDGVQSTHRPGSIAWDGASLWQSTPNPVDRSGVGELVRRDAKTGQIQSRVPLDTGEDMGFVFGYGWVAHMDGPKSASLDKVDQASGQVVASIALPGTFADANAGPTTLWYLSRGGDLVEIDPVSGSTIAQHRVDAVEPAAVVPIGSSLWVCDCRHGEILRVDPATGAVEQRVEIDQRAFLIGTASADGNTLWLLDPDAATLTPLDATTGEAGRSLGIGGGNVYDARIGLGAVWVAAGRSLLRFDQGTGNKHEIEMPPGTSAGGLALNETDGIVWVENCGCPTD
jgi:class 3 adenylate cyclase